MVIFKFSVQIIIEVVSNFFETKSLHQGNEPVRDFVYAKISFRITIYSMKEVIKNLIC